jgi:hypothetical protein
MNNGSTHPWGNTMIGSIKLAAFGAVLSCGIAAVYDLPTRKLEAAVASKLQDRLPGAGAAVATGVVSVRRAAAPARPGKGDRLAPSDETCARQGGSDIPGVCLAGRDGAAPRVVRIITIENREAANTSTLTRVPSITTAQR